LDHGLVEGDVLEQLDPGKKAAEANGACKQIGGKCQVLEISIVILNGDPILQLGIGAEDKENVEALMNYGEDNDQQVNLIPGTGQIGSFQAHQLHDLLKNVVQGENNEHDLEPQEEVVKAGEKWHKFDCIYNHFWIYSTVSRKFKEHGYHTEEIDVGIVNGELNEYSSGSSINP
jgi:hypothetical protein